MKSFSLFLLLIGLFGCTTVQGLYARLTKRVETIACGDFIEKVPSSGKAVRRIAFIGDFGTGGKDQKQVAAALTHLYSEQPFSFVLGLGDNFYPYGVSSSHDPRFQSDFEQVYRGIDAPFYMALGNHDHFLEPRAQIAYHSPRWHMPCAYYGLDGQGFRIFVLDTPQIIADKTTVKDQVDRLENFLCKYDGLKIVAGHHPLVSREDKDRTSEQAKLRQELLPSLKKCGVDIYLSGHSHLLAHDQVEGIQQLISGGGGGKNTPCQKNRGEESKFCYGGFGFATLTIQADQSVDAEFFNKNGKTLYLRKIKENTH